MNSNASLPASVNSSTQGQVSFTDLKTALNASGVNYTYQSIETAEVVQTSTAQYIHIGLLTDTNQLHYFLLNKTLQSAKKTSTGMNGNITVDGYNIMVNLTGVNVTAFDVYYDASSLFQSCYATFDDNSNPLKTESYLLEYTIDNNGVIVDEDLLYLSGCAT